MQNQKQKNNKSLLKEYIKGKIRVLLNERKLNEKKEELKNLARIGIIVKKFPGVKKSLEKLMSPSFAYYVKNIEIVSPKPTTFRVTLNNTLDFELSYSNKSYIAKVSGKKYYLLNQDETQRATQSITDLLSLSPEPKSEPKQEQNQEFDQGLANDFNSMGGGGEGSFPGGEDVGGPASTGLPELQPEEVPTTPVGGSTPSSAPTGGVGGPSPSI